MNQHLNLYQIQIRGGGAPRVMVIRAFVRFWRTCGCNNYRIHNCKLSLQQTLLRASMLTAWAPADQNVVALLAGARTDIFI